MFQNWGVLQRVRLLRLVFFFENPPTGTRKEPRNVQLSICCVWLPGACDASRKSRPETRQARRGGSAKETQSFDMFCSRFAEFSDSNWIKIKRGLIAGRGQHPTEHLFVGAHSTTFLDCCFTRVARVWVLFASRKSQLGGDRMQQLHEWRLCYRARVTDGTIPLRVRGMTNSNHGNCAYFHPTGRDEEHCVQQRNTVHQPLLHCEILVSGLLVRSMVVGSRKNERE